MKINLCNVMLSRKKLKKPSFYANVWYFVFRVVRSVNLIEKKHVKSMQHSTSLKEIRYPTSSNQHLEPHRVTPNS
jgi:outer membrane protein assembly factor BamE (lipoprotein component of BamABCDE complex)